MTHYTVSGVVRELERRYGVAIRPQDLANMLYQRVLPDDLCPVVGGRRMIPEENLPIVEAALRARGLLSEPEHEEKTCRSIL